MGGRHNGWEGDNEAGEGKSILGMLGRREEEIIWGKGYMGKWFPSSASTWGFCTMQVGLAQWLAPHNWAIVFLSECRWGWWKARKRGTEKGRLVFGGKYRGKQEKKKGYGGFQGREIAGEGDMRLPCKSFQVFSYACMCACMWFFQKKLRMFLQTHRKLAVNSINKDWFK